MLWIAVLRAIRDAYNSWSYLHEGVSGSSVPCPLYVCTYVCRFFLRRKKTFFRKKSWPPTPSSVAVTWWHFDISDCLIMCCVLPVLGPHYWCHSFHITDYLISICVVVVCCVCVAWIQWHVTVVVQWYIYIYTVYTYMLYLVAPSIVVLYNINYKLYSIVLLWCTVSTWNFTQYLLQVAATYYGKYILYLKYHLLNIWWCGRLCQPWLQYKWKCESSRDKSAREMIITYSKIYVILVCVFVHELIIRQ